MSYKKIKQLLIGSNNQGKIKEIRDLVPENINIFSIKDFKKIKSPSENGKSFIENSYIKAKYYNGKTGITCLADDSGIEIDLLKKKPGIFSARWGGKNSNFDLAIKTVYSKLNKIDKNWKKKKVRARFICALTIFWTSRKYYSATGMIEGRISKKKLGTNGFGYDPIFIPLKYKRTFGQMKKSEKHKIDHRFRAFRKIRKFF